ncbi:MAG: hypothetical protein LBL03_00720 [Endomicrobium sp.]|jgi:hypothetical protein|nr:hypothetical protein [Endomicrobium sp.]
MLSALYVNFFDVVSYYYCAGKNIKRRIKKYENLLISKNKSYFNMWNELKYKNIIGFEYNYC